MNRPIECCWWCDEGATARRPLVEHEDAVMHESCLEPWRHAQAFKRAPMEPGSRRGPGPFAGSTPAGSTVSGHSKKGLRRSMAGSCQDVLGSPLLFALGHSTLRQQGQTAVGPERIGAPNGASAGPSEHSAARALEQAVLPGMEAVGCA